MTALSSVDTDADRSAAEDRFRLGHMGVPVGLAAEPERLVLVQEPECGRAVQQPADPSVVRLSVLAEERGDDGEDFCAGQRVLGVQTDVRGGTGEWLLLVEEIHHFVAG